MYYNPCFFPKMAPKSPQIFIIYFLIHIDVFMLCRKFELIPTKSFRVMGILTISENTLYRVFSENGSIMCILNDTWPKIRQIKIPTNHQNLLIFPPPKMPAIWQFFNPYFIEVSCGFINSRCGME